MRLAMQLSQFCRLWWPNRVLSDSNQHPVACGCQQHVAANTLISMCCAITSASIFNLLWNWFVHKWPKWSVKPWNYINWMLWNRHNIFFCYIQRTDWNFCELQFGPLMRQMCDADFLFDLISFYCDASENVLKLNRLLSMVR